MKVKLLKELYINGILKPAGCELEVDTDMRRKLEAGGYIVKFRQENKAIIKTINLK